jgi:hypothetical protein
MRIFQLTFDEYQNLINTFQLPHLSSQSLGLDTFPLSDLQNIKLLYQEYIERDARLEEYVNEVKNCKSIVFAEASRMGNKNYIYRGVGNNFYFSDKTHNYFKNVIEAQWYDSIIIDFFSPIGINHTSKKNGSRDYLNNQYKSNFLFYNDYLDSYINSILTLMPGVDIENVSIVIAAPNRTRDSILSYLKSKYSLPIHIKCYKINEIGATDQFELL